MMDMEAFKSLVQGYNGEWIGLTIGEDGLQNVGPIAEYRNLPLTELSESVEVSMENNSMNMGNLIGVGLILLLVICLIVSICRRAKRKDKQVNNDLDNNVLCNY